MGVYFDNNATTPLDPRVREAMLPHLGGLHGNPSSAHGWGRAAHDAVETAREHVADLLGATPEEIVFTASGTESNNLAILGAASRHGGRGHFVISSLEHPSIRAAVAGAVERGMEQTEVAPNADGCVDPKAVEAALRRDTRMVCLMQANNELGTVQPVAEVAAICREHGVEVLCDAVQAVGKIPVRVAELGVDYLTVGGHKFHGPLGVAALYVRAGRELPPLLLGAPQEGGRRPGTENVPGIVGLGEAARIAHGELEERHHRLLDLRERFEAGLAEIPGAVVHCAEAARLPHTTHVAFLGRSGHALMIDLDAAGYAVSTGAACHAGKPQPSRALLSMGVEEAESLASLRVSFGLTNTKDEVDAFLSELGSRLSSKSDLERRALTP